MATMAGAQRIRHEKDVHYSLSEEQEPASLAKCDAATKKRVLGVIPKIEFKLPEEDSLVGRSQQAMDEPPQESWNWQIDLVAKAIKDSADIERITEIAEL